MQNSKLESANEKYLYFEVRKRGGQCIKLNPAWNIGIPDRLILLPGAWLCLAELKRPKGGVWSKSQQYWHKVIKNLGFPCYVLSTKDEIDELLKEYDKGPLVPQPYIDEENQ